ACSGQGVGRRFGACRALGRPSSGSNRGQPSESGTSTARDRRGLVQQVGLKAEQVGGLIHVVPLVQELETQTRGPLDCLLEHARGAPGDIVEQRWLMLAQAKQVVAAVSAGAKYDLLP